MLSARTFAYAFLVACGFAGACGGEAFLSDDPDDAQAGSRATGGAGAEGAAQPGEGGDASTLGGAGSSGSSAGGTASVGGAGDGSAGDGGEGTDPGLTLLRPLDDMEDGNNKLLESNGSWYVFKDKSGGVITPAYGTTFTMAALSPARGTSTKAVAVTVSGFTGWGAAVGLDLSYVMDVRQPTDLTDARGVRFWAKASKALPLRFQAPTGDTDPFGGKCSGTGENACYAHFGQAVAVGTSWGEVTIAFNALKQEGAGRRAPSFDSRSVYSMFFVIGPNQSVSLWIDDIVLVR